MKIRFPIPVLLLLASCASVRPEPAPLGCTTRCGLFAPLANAEQCQALQAFESKAVRQFAADVPAWTADKTCKALDGYTVMPWPHVGPRDVMLGAADHPITGRTYLKRSLIFVSTQTWGDSALAHELAHAVSWELEGDASHDNWTARGICHAINMASDHFHCDYSAPQQGWVMQ